MDINEKIRVLVVDDSSVSRGMIIRGITSDPMIEVCATATDPFEARDKILAVKPDVLTCDIEMPKMNGIEFIRKLLPQYYIPVIMVSALSDAVFEALSAVAVDFVAKPNPTSRISHLDFISDLILKIKAAAASKAAPDKAKNGVVPHSANFFKNESALIAIGASTGGTEAIYSILSRLPPNFPGIVIVQHIPPGFSNMFAQRLNSQTALEVKEAESGDIVAPGKAFVAPGGKHMIVKKFGGRYKIECFEEEKVNGHRPSVDVLFESVAKEAGKNAVGILLTGMGYDGAKGLAAIRRRQGRTIGQDEASSVVYGMPKVAYDIGGVEVQADLNKIPGILFEMLA